MGSNLAAIGYLVAAIRFILALRGPELAGQQPAGQPLRHDRHDHRDPGLATDPAASRHQRLPDDRGRCRDRRRDRLRRCAADRDDGHAAARGGLPLARGPGRRVRGRGRLSPGDFGITGEGGHIHHLSRFEMGLGIIIGAITFSAR